MKRYVGFLAVFILGLMVTSNANAALTLTIDDPGDLAAATVVTDLDADGVVTFFGAVGAWTINSVTGISKPAAPTGLEMDLNSVDVSGGAGTLIIMLSDTGFISTGSISWLTAFGGTTAGTISASAWVDPENLLNSMDPADLLASIGPLSGPAFSASSSALTGTLTGLFSSTVRVVITHTGAGTTSFDVNTSAPEPTTMLLLGVGLAMLGVVGLRRRNTVGVVLLILMLSAVPSYAVTSTTFVCGAGNDGGVPDTTCSGTLTVDEAADTVTLTFTAFAPGGAGGQIQLIGIQMPDGETVNYVATTPPTGYVNDSAGGSFLFDAEMSSSTGTSGFDAGDVAFSFTWAYTQSGADPVATDFTALANQDGGCDGNAFKGVLWGCLHVTGQGILGQSEFIPLKADDVVPEPSVLALLGTGLVGLGVVARRKLTR